MKIAQFTPYFPPHKGGLQIVAENISKHLVGGKYAEVINITSSIGQDYEKPETRIIYKNLEIGYYKDGYQVICIPSFEIIHNFPCPKLRTKNFRKIITYIKEQNIDIIQTHTRFFLQTFMGGIIAKYLKKPRIHVEHGSGFVTGIARRKTATARIYDQILGRLSFNYCDKIISINKTNLNFIHKFVTKEKCETIYNGIEFPKQISNRATHTGEKKVQMAFIGRLIGLKGVDILIESCKGLIEDGYRDFSLQIIGDGEEKTQLEMLRKKYELEGYISFLGAKNHDEIMSSILPQIDILINPSLQEGLPTTVLEGLLCKCVVVATDVGGTSEISDKKDCILVKKGDKNDLKKGIQYAMKNYRELQGLSYKHIKDTFNWEKSAEKYYKIYQNIL